MSKAPPSFQFYAAAFSEGTDDLSLPQVGGYVRLLCSQWAKGSVPGGNAQKLAVIMRCSVPAAKSVWAAIADKFDKGDDGQYRNARLEDERLKQAKYRALQSNRGKESAAAAKRNRASTEPEPSSQPDANPKPPGNSLSSSLSLPSGSSNNQIPVSAGSQSLPPRAPAPLTPRGQVARWGQIHSDHATGFCDWMCLPNELVYQFAGRIAERDHTDVESEVPKVVHWAHGVRANGIIPTGRWFEFWNAQWELAHGSSKPVTEGVAGRHARTAKRLDDFVENG